VKQWLKRPGTLVIENCGVSPPEGGLAMIDQSPFKGFFVKVAKRWRLRQLDLDKKH
jgi:hypothetical protein